jgi:hypothetical protein
MALESFDYTRSPLFKTLVPPEARPYGNIILNLSTRKKISPCVTVFLGSRESKWGWTLTPPEPGGTGDFAPRKWGPYRLPPDGKGWGRGLFQLDFGANSEWLKANEWWLPDVNVGRGLDLLVQNIAFFSRQAIVRVGGQVVADRLRKVRLREKAAARRGVKPGVYQDPRPLAGGALLRAALAAYNTGCLNVLYSLAVGLPADFTTAHGDYSEWIVSRALELDRRFSPQSTKAPV